MINETIISEIAKEISNEIGEKGGIRFLVLFHRALAKRGLHIPSQEKRTELIRRVCPMVHPSMDEPYPGNSSL